MSHFIKKSLILSGLAVLLTACGNSDNQSVTVSSDVPDNQAVTAIPDVMHGKWGMSASDCLEGEGESYSWIKVDAGQIKFFENSYDLVEAVSFKDNRFEGVFDYLGYEETTRSTESLTLASDGEKMTFESEPPLIYSRCD